MVTYFVVLGQGSMRAEEWRRFDRQWRFSLYTALCFDVLSLRMYWLLKRKEKIIVKKILTFPDSLTARSDQVDSPGQ